MFLFLKRRGWSNRSKNQKPQTILGRGLPTKPQKIPGPKITPQKSHAEFPSLKNVQKALNDITLCTLSGCALFAELRGRVIVLNTQKVRY